MKREAKQDKRSAAFGQAIGTDPELRGLKEAAAERLHNGEDHGAVLDWLAGETSGMCTDMEMLAGLDRWMAAWLLDWAKTGEPGPIPAETQGQVMVQQLVVDGESTPVVIAVASVLSDVRALAEEFVLMCDRVFPHATRRRFGNPQDGARYFRLRREGWSWADIAREKVRDDRPDLDEESESFRELVSMERETVKKAATRWWKEYGDKILGFLSPDSE